MRNFLILLLLNLSLFAYTETFDVYSGGTQSSDLNDTGITFSSSGEWEVFNTPFSIFDTAVLLEPSSVNDNNPLTISLKQTQCQFSLTFATDGEDSLNVVGLYRDKEVYHQRFKGVNKGGSYVGTFQIDTKLDAVRISTKDRKRLLIDTIQTRACRLDSYNLSDGMLAHYSFEEDNTTQGVLGNGLHVKNSLTLSQESNPESISLWINPSSVEDMPTILQTDNIQVSINSDSFLQLDFNDAFFSPFVSDIKIDSNKWIYLTLTREAEQFNIYINGELHGSFTVESKLSKTENSIILGDDNFGMIDELRLYTRELSEDEIIELFHTRETFTQSFKQTYESAFEAGKSFCIKNPQSCGLLAGRTDENISIRSDINALQGKTYDIQWYLWKADNSDTYLMSGDNNNSSVWQMVPETRQWKPVHNAGAFDGFDGQGLLFDSITLSEDGKQITFGNELNTTEEN